MIKKTDAKAKIDFAATESVEISSMASDEICPSDPVTLSFFSDSLGWGFTDLLKPHIKAIKAVKGVSNLKEILSKREAGAKQNFTNIKAASIQKSGLQKKSAFRLCPKFLAGSCRSHDSCSASHEICEIVGIEVEQKKPQLDCIPNYLSTNPRVIPSNGRVFDNDGPGQFSNAGPRHQNDHVNIQDITILPTVDEILSLRNPYIPKKDANDSHRLPIGQSRLIDINFRQLRYDCTESIIDICYHASQCLVSMCSNPAMPIYDTYKKTPMGRRYSLFRDVSFTHSQHELKGTMIDASFSCPQHLGENSFHASMELEEGMLAALIGLDKEEAALSVTFLEIQDINNTVGSETETNDTCDLQG